MGERDEIKRLKKENHDLKKKLYKLEMEMHPNGDEANEDAKCFATGNYFSYLLAKIRRKKFFPTFEKYFRNSLWVTRIFRWGVLLYQYIQAGAFVLLYTAAFILIIPIILAAAALTLIIALILRDKNTKLLFSEIKDDIVFLIPTDKEKFNRVALRQFAKEHEDATVLVVSPFFLNKTGIGENERMYVCFRKEYDNVFILRNYFFFYFRRRLKMEKNCNVKEIYTDKEDTDGSVLS